MELLFGASLMKARHHAARRKHGAYLQYLLLFTLTGHLSAADLACKSSGYCSLELQPSSFTGPVTTNKEVKLALEALHFRKEIILSADTRPDDGSQVSFSFFCGEGRGGEIPPTRTTISC